MSVKTYNCTDGGAQWCQGCYTMEESTDHLGKPDGYGDWVRKEDYDAVAAALRCCNIDCGELHHTKTDRHDSGPCPVVARIRALLAP